MDFCGISLAEYWDYVQLCQFISSSSMDLFLVNQAASTTTTGKVIAIALIGIASLALLAKTFASNDEDDSDGEAQNASRKPAGIINMGNTCFVNSLLQALASLSSFEENLREVMGAMRGRPDRHEELLIELAAVMRKINTNDQEISVQHLLGLINGVKEGLINLEQQDTHELYAALIGSFEEVVNRRKTIDLSNSVRMQEREEVQNRLIGFTKSSITCTLCKNQTAIKIHPFYDLSLEIQSPYVFDIRTALMEFQREERIDSWTCTSCTIQRHVRKLKDAAGRLKGGHKQQLAVIADAIVDYLQKGDLMELEISEVNAALGNFVINFAREYQEMREDPERDSIFVEMEGVQTTITKRTLITKYPKILVVHFKQLTINPLTGEPHLLRKHIGFERSLAVKMKGGEKHYHLTSLLTHIGNESMGHYFTFRRESRESNNWFVISDSSSRRCEWDYVKGSRAYMLFYEAN